MRLRSVMHSVLHFLDLMAMADHGVRQNGSAAILGANAQTISTQFKSQFNAILAQRNAVKHKKVDVEDGACAPLIIARASTVAVWSCTHSVRFARWCFPPCVYLPCVRDWCQE